MSAPHGSASTSAPVKKIVQPSDIPPLANAFSGALGGAVATLAVFPLDLITTRMQLQTAVKDEPKSSTAAVSTKQYTGVVDAFTKIYAKSGILGFYDGALSDTIATTAQAFFYFYAYEDLRSRRVNSIALKNNGRAPSTLGVGEELVIGSLAGIFAKFFICPLNNVVARQQAAGLVQESLPAPATEKAQQERNECKSAMHVVRAIYSERGITGFWSGYKATVLLSINPSLTYYFFQTLKSILLPRRLRDNPTSSQLFFLAAIAKTMATLITYPVILAKTRIQVKQRAQSLFRILSSILAKDGIPGLYLGARSQILKGFFSQGITMMTKDQIARFIIWAYFVFIKYSS